MKTRLQKAVDDLRTTPRAITTNKNSIQTRINELGQRLASSREAKAKDLMASFLEDAKYLEEALRLHESLYGKTEKGSNQYYRWASNVTGLVRSHIVTLLEIEKTIRTWPKNKTIPSISVGQFKQLMRLPQDYISGVIRGEIRLTTGKFDNLKIKSNPKKVKDASLEKLVDRCIEDDLKKRPDAPLDNPDGRSLSSLRAAKKRLNTTDRTKDIVYQIFSLWNELNNHGNEVWDSLLGSKECDNIVKSLRELGHQTTDRAAYLTIKRTPAPTRATGKQQQAFA